MIEINRFYIENCLDTMARMPDEFIDLTVTSPPYDNLRDYNGYEFDFESIAKELYRVTKQGGVVVWVVNDETKNGSESLTSAKQKIFFREQCGFNIHDTMIWHKKNFIPLTHNRFEQAFEYMFILVKPFNSGDMFKEIYLYFKEQSDLAGRKKLLKYVKEHTLGHCLRFRDFQIPTLETYLNLQKSGYFKKSYTDIIEWKKNLYRDVPTFNPILKKTNNGGKKYRMINANDYGNNSALRKREQVLITKDEMIYDNVWNIETANSNLTNSAPFPEKLAADHIYSWSNEADLIYDPFVGSGTTVKMAIKLKRNWIASEISENYIKNIAEKRIKPLLMQETLF